ncbi:MAG: hypothetical protein H6747_11280 [Deltaproteobacteria bacterium]|nr:hypothetical protein [Deltaproteobacteria bacterium]
MRSVRWSIGSTLALCVLFVSACFRDPDDVGDRFSDALGDGKAGILGPQECEDDNPCTEDRSAAGVGCLHLPVAATPCADAQPCMWQPSCVDGECKGTPRLFDKSLALSSKVDTVAAAAELPNGDLLLVGHAHMEGIAGGYNRPFLLHEHGDGEQADPKQKFGLSWLDNGTSPEVALNVQVYGLVQMPSVPGGPVWATVGDTREVLEGAKMHAYLRTFTVEAGVKSHVEPSGIGDNTTFFAAATASTGAVLAVGFRDQSATDKPDMTALACRFFPDATFNNCLLVPPSEAAGGADFVHGQLHAVVAVPGPTERWVVGGTRAKTESFEYWDGKPNPHVGIGSAGGLWLAAIDGPPAKLAWQKLIKPAGEWPAANVRNLTMLDDQTVLVYGVLGKPDHLSGQGWRAPYGGEGENWLLRVRVSDGAVLAERRIQFPGWSGRATVLGDRIVVHQNQSVENGDAQLYFFDKGFELLGSASLPTCVPEAMVPLANGDLLLAGRRPSSGSDPGDAQWVRVDPLGSLVCEPGSKCPLNSLLGCDDGDPCTVDVCDAAAGCQHDKQPDGVVCAPGKVCGAAGCATKSSP